MLPHWKRNRTALGGVAVLLITGIAIALYFGVFRTETYKPEALMSYLPPRHASVVYLDFRALRNSGVFDLIAGQAGAEEPEYRTFVEQTGFNYKEDLHQVAMSSAAGVHYFVVEGRFDWEKLRAHAAASGGGCNGDACWTKGSTPDRVISFRPLGRTLMALASGREQSAVRDIAKRVTGTTMAVPAEPMWMHVPGEVLRSPGNLPSGTALFARAISTAENAVLTLGPQGERYELKMNLSCKSAEEAAVLRTQMAEITNLLQKLINREGKQPNADDLSGILSAGVFTRDGNQVLARWPITQAFLQSLAKGS